MRRTKRKKPSKPGAFAEPTPCLETTLFEERREAVNGQRPVSFIADPQLAQTAHDYSLGSWHGKQTDDALHIHIIGKNGVIIKKCWLISGGLPHGSGTKIKAYTLSIEFFGYNFFAKEQQKVYQYIWKTKHILTCKYIIL